MQPVSLSGPTWERIKSAAAEIPADKHIALIAAATLDEQKRPRADLLFAYKKGNSWYVAGSVGYAKASGVEASVAVVGSW